jgi:FG-GAP repeat/Prealbumin-like fold domain
MCDCAQSEYGWPIVETTLTPGRSWPRIDVRRSLPPTLAGALVTLLVLTVAPAREPVATTPVASASGLSALPLAARPLVSRTLGRDQASYAIRTSASGLVARNAPQALSARFGAHGVQVRSGEDTLSLRLRATGYGRSLEPVVAAAPAGHANRVSYRRGSLTEWYANGPLGLEQGFTLKAPPAVARTGPLSLALSLSGSLHPSLGRDARSLSFAGSSLRYSGLAAFDARGHRIPARLELRGHTLLIRVNDRGARYPLTIDPFVQLAKLTASDGGDYDILGDSVAVSGDTIVAGGGGAAYVFVKPAGGWASGTQRAKLTASDAPAYGFGPVAIDGDTIIAGAPGTNVSGHVSQGAVYVFVKPASGWADGTQTARLIVSNGHDDDGLGFSVAISGDAIVAGALFRSVSGAAYVFVKPAGGWADGMQTAKLTASDGAAYDQLGTSVAISGDTVVAGAPYSDVSGHVDQGAAYVFVKPAGGWASEIQAAKLTASDGAQSDYLGSHHSVAIAGDTIVAGGGGAAYVFVKPTGGWASGTQRRKLTASDAPAYGFGPVAIDGDTIIAGAPNATVSGHAGQGAAYVFVKPAGGWASGTETAKLTASGGAAGDRFGESVPISSDTIVAGAPYAHVSGHAYQGAAYVFARVPAAVTVTKHLVPASDPGRFDLRVGQKVVKAGAGEGGTGATGVAPGTYRVSEAAAAGTSLSGYASSIACTINSNPGPAANGTTHLDVTVVEGDEAVCTITNRRKAQITLTKQLVPASSAGRFDLKVAGTVVRASGGNGASGSIQLRAGTYRVSESGAAGTSLADYATSIACTVNGNPGPSASGTTHLDVTVVEADVVKCTLTNKRKAQVTLTKHLVPASDPGRFDLKLTSGTLTRVVKTGAGDGDSGSIQVAPGTWTVLESAAAGTTLSDYTSSIACTRNGNPGPSGNLTSLKLTLSPADVLVCTITNQRK